MHFTFRCKLDAGTPADVIEGAHVYVEIETLDDLPHAVEDVLDQYGHAINDGVSTAFLDESVMRRLYPDGEDRPGNDPAPHVTEAIANLRMVEGRIAARYDDSNCDDDGLGECLADLQQAIRFLTGAEQPA